MGGAEITHPYHPLNGQKFRILKIKKIAGEDIFSLRGSSTGTFGIPRNWTDQSEPHMFANDPLLILSYPYLVKLSELVSLINPIKQGLDK